MFVGRRAELSELIACYDRARTGHSTVVSIEGPPGIGKTALVQAFLTEADPSVLVAASGHEDEMTLPLGVITQMARAPTPSSGAALARLQEVGGDVGRSPQGVCCWTPWPSCRAVVRSS